VLKGEHETLGLCSDLGGEARIGDPSAFGLTTDVEYDGANCLVVVGCVSEVPLFPGFGGAVVVVVKDLIEPVLFLLEGVAVGLTE
jgi:hypothetical protein